MRNEADLVFNFFFRPLFRSSALASVLKPSIFLVSFIVFEEEAINRHKEIIDETNPQNEINFLFSSKLKF
jgi:hypothetical protein